MTSAEFSRPIAAETVGDDGRNVAIEASREEGAALALRFGWQAVDRLKAHASVVREAATIAVRGHISAIVVQSCVTSGALVHESIEEDFALRFADPATLVPEAEELELADVDLDTLPIEGGAIDLGEAVAQTLALAVDPFPRSAAAEAALAETRTELPGAFAELKSILSGRPT